MGLGDGFDGGFALDGVGVVFEVEFFELFVGREFFKILVVGLFFGGDDADQFGELFPHEEPDFAHVRVDAENNAGLGVEVVADQFILPLAVLPDCDLGQDLFKAIRQQKI